ncbi:FMN-binding negative transcriptional regulator [Pseudomarimonas salicorniae]|uniref:FMN-binding negative transcriptional regulator n=1 Tax=Pseudomarimonas salicorniae TaxID=2933270 RepID=A0ABT0GJK3_9GAMM|nr:FMN-binding negative transcriptional regulator [Lysobacter sp. CAU 1642]MCK7594715.1 FMN-binding negative transcriptional regulator [Lysobacter sp. CAU 1642]
MYLPRRFAETDPAELDALLARDAFVTLVTVDAEGLPFASHLPVLHRWEGERLLLEGHWARPNPQAGHRGPALAIVHGPHAYVSPTWYTDPRAQVPTWNYAVAHLSGPLAPFEETEALQTLVAELSAKYEEAVGSDWRFPGSAPDTLSDLRGIIGFRLEVERLQLKFKLNQNHPEANVVGAAAALERLGGESAEVAALMRERLARRPARA